LIPEDERTIHGTARSAKIIFGRVMASDLPAVETNLPPAIAGGAWFLAKINISGEPAALAAMARFALNPLGNEWTERRGVSPHEYQPYKKRTCL